MKLELIIRDTHTHTQTHTRFFSCAGLRRLFFLQIWYFFWSAFFFWLLGFLRVSGRCRGCRKLYVTWAGLCENRFDEFIPQNSCKQTSRSDLSSSIISWYSNTKRQLLIKQVEVPWQLDSQDLDSYFSQSNPTFHIWESVLNPLPVASWLRNNERHTVYD